MLKTFIAAFAAALACLSMAQAYASGISRSQQYEIGGDGGIGESFREAFHYDCYGKVRCVLPDSPGGIVSVFQSAADEVNIQRRKIAIAGKCASACVVFADRARDNVCIAPTARLLVHKTTQVKASYTWADGRVDLEVLRADPPQSPAVNRAVKKLGGYPFTGVRLIPFEIAKHLWRVCDPSENVQIM